MSDRQCEVLTEKTVYRGFFRLTEYTLKHTLYNGGWSGPIQREIFQRGACVAVLLYDPFRDEVVLIEQFRAGAIEHPESAWLLEIVAGAIEEGETPGEVALREASEEAGCSASDLFEIMQFYTTPGSSSERITLFCARVDSSTMGGIHGLPEEGEDILVKIVKLSEIPALLETGQIQSAIAIVGLQWLCMHEAQLKQKWTTNTVA